MASESWIASVAMWLVSYVIIIIGDCTSIDNDLIANEQFGFDSIWLVTMGTTAVTCKESKNHLL